MAGFAAPAVVGFKRNLRLIAAGLAGHGALDVLHGRLVTNPGVPAWWPAFCLAYDVVVAGSLAWLVGRPARTPHQPAARRSVPEVETRRQRRARIAPRPCGPPPLR